MDFDRLTTRDVPIVPERAALLVIDVQNFSARRDGGEFRDMPEAEVEARYGWFFRRIEAETLPEHRPPRSPPAAPPASRSSTPSSRA